MSAETLVLAVLATAKEDWGPGREGEISGFLHSEWFESACYYLGLDPQETRRAIVGYRAPVSVYDDYMRRSLKKPVDKWAGLGMDYAELRLTGWLARKWEEE